MNDMMTKGAIAYIINRLLESGREAVNDKRLNPGSDYYIGKSDAYYEMLDILRNELEARDEDLKYYGIEIDIEKELIDHS